MIKLIAPSFLILNLMLLPVSWAEESILIAPESKNNCETILDNYYNQIKHNFKSERIKKTAALHKIEISSKDRMNLRNQWVGQSQICDLKLLSILHLMRDQEDFWALASELQIPIEGKHLDFKKIATPLKDTRKYFPYETANGLSYEPVKFNNGDIMITRGFSWTSAAISQAASNKNHFSHAVFVYVSPDGVEHTIESYIGKGVTMYPMDEALKNENARIQLYRSRDSTLSRKAGNYVYSNYILKRKVDYDYISDFSNDNNLTCAEIPYWAYRKASKDAVIIPSTSSTIKATEENQLEGLGIPSGKFFSPGDLETDSRFELIAEWTDYRLLQENILRDAVMNRLFEWTTNQGYHFTFSSKSFWSRNLVYYLRKADWIWRGVSGIFDIPDFPKELPQSYIEAITTLSSPADFLFEKLKIKNDMNKEMFGYPLTRQELIDFLEYYRKLDEQRFENDENFELHEYIERD